MSKPLFHGEIQVDMPKASDHVSYITMNDQKLLIMTPEGYEEFIDGLITQTINAVIDSMKNAQDEFDARQ